ncbi:MAG: dehydratase, partial [Flammeovirgaceae bacterium]|nr:dehydratase [Flammeovirgaceae bacterium]
MMTDKPYTTSFNHLMDLKDAIGKELGLTEWNVITQEKINTFAELTGDT